ncbi:MAG: hypothetical protein WKF84_02250 [Pyrinomonadaceae bacterium]
MSDRIQSLREVALALLSEVDTLDDQPRSATQLKVNLHDEVRRYENQPHSSRPGMYARSASSRRPAPRHQSDYA